MKICQIGTGTLPVTPLVNGGVEKYIHYLCTSLVELGHEVTLIDIPCSDRPKTTYNVEEVTTIIKNHGSGPTHVAARLLFGFFSSLLIRKLTNTRRFDLVNFQSQFSALFGIQTAQRMGISSVFTLHNPIWSDQSACKSLNVKIKFFLERTAEKSSNSIICLSKNSANNITTFLGVDSAKITVVPVGIDEIWFSKPPVSISTKSKYAPNNELIILHVARIASYKNQLTVIRAIPDIVKQIPNVKFVFIGPVGSNQYLKALEKEIRDLGVGSYVKFAGTVLFSELRELYYFADIFVFPSLQENMPQAMLEAMAAGKPIVFSSIPPLMEILPVNAGIMISPCDYKSLARETVRLLLNKRFRDELGVKAQSHACQKYKWSSVAQQIARVYASLRQAD